MEESLLIAIKNRLKTELNFVIVRFEEIKAGGNNRLFVLSSTNKKLLLKIYNSYDDRQRLEREFHALSFLNRNSFECIPKAYLKDAGLNYAVYSFERGETKKSSEIVRKDLDQMISFIVRLQNKKPEETKEEFMSGVMACSSFQDYLNNINIRIEWFKNNTERESLPDLVKELLQSDFIQEINDLIKSVIDKYSREEISAQMSMNDKRLSPVDFGPHNTIFKYDGSAIFVDFEYFGWDDPNRLVGDFLNHDQTMDISPDDKDYFLNEYLKSSTLSTSILDRLNTVRQLIAIEWLTIYLSSLTKEKISIRKFADTNFDEAKYIQTQVGKYQSRLKTLLKN